MPSSEMRSLMPMAFGAECWVLQEATSWMIVDMAAWLS